MRLILFLIWLCFFTNCRVQDNEFLFQIKENNRIGFIDHKGNIVIKPKFRSAGNFSEGLIAARMNGLYGYVDRTGEFVIAPKFEYATDFKEGYAIVVQKNIPTYIDKNGRTPFESNYATINHFENGRAIVGTKSNQFGLIDKKGRLFVDTAYLFIENLGSGLLKVGVDNTEHEYDTKVGIIDTLGNIIIPIGTYKEVNAFVQGYARVVTPPIPGDSTGESAKTGFIDTKGNVAFYRGSTIKDGWISGDMSNKIAKITHYKYWIPEEEGISFTSEKNYDGFINIKGDIILNDTLIDKVTDFSNQRAFIKYKGDDFYMVDTLLKKVSNTKFKDVLNNGFNKGYAFVTVAESNEYGLINTAGKFIFQPQFEHVIYGETIEDYFFFGKRSPTKEEPYRILYGVATVTGKILIAPTFDAFDNSGYIGGLLKVRINKKQSYIDKKGNIVWQEKDHKTIEDFNIDYMNRGHFYAHSEPHEDDISGYGHSENAPKIINENDNFPENQLSVTIKTDQKHIIDNKWNGYKVYIANTSKHNIEFDAQDSRLYMKSQAQDSTGQWRDIEYLPSSWCGNSYHKLILKQENYWEFTVPKYDGDMKTKVRISLTYNSPNSESDSRKEVTKVVIYSNEFEASINPSQFWRRQEYYPSGIMDPYNN
jgi:hypothetical protein